jgi:AcrR family transcriptional regulator
LSYQRSDTFERACRKCGNADIGRATEGFFDLKTPVYNSEQIVERRRRILHVARQIIFESGIDGFSIRELCSRADVAQRTIYNAFGSKEGVIAHAIRQYQMDFYKRIVCKFRPDTLEGRMELLIRVHSRNTQIKPYTRAIMSVYYSTTAHRAIRDAIRGLNADNLRPLCERLTREAQFAPGVSTDSFMQLAISSSYAVLLDWCVGDLNDDELVDRICENFLVMMVGSTCGETRLGAERWLEDLRDQRPSWLALRELAAVAAPADNAAAVKMPAEN